jgi:hypothetical protein
MIFFRKPVPTFRDHAPRRLAILCPSLAAGATLPRNATGGGKSPLAALIKASFAVHEAAR